MIDVLVCVGIVIWWLCVGVVCVVFNVVVCVVYCIGILLLVVEVE